MGVASISHYNRNIYIYIYDHSLIQEKPQWSVVLPSASRGLQCPEGKQGRGDQESEAYWRKTRPSAHLSHTDPTSLGNQQTGRRLNLDSVQHKSYNGAAIL